MGSNNWALTGSRTEHGKPILANDPHLMLTIPAPWYLAHISTPDTNLVGATLPGIPAIILGRNDFIAWAFTNTGADSQDLYLERSPPGYSGPDGQSFEYYETPDGKARYETRTETIKVRFAQDERITIRRSRHGPIISDNDTEIQSLLPGSDKLSLALNWAGFYPGDVTLRFFLKAARAVSADDLLDAARDYQSPLQNIVYADKSGVIGFVAAGRAPLRSAENDLQGRAPAPGWRAAYDWQGFIPFERLPQEQAPAADYIVTANDKITPEDYPYLIAADWAPPYRAGRIAALINRQAGHDLTDSQLIQMDTKSTVAERLLPLLLAARSQEPLQSTLKQSTLTQFILDRLKHWDFNMRGDSFEPLVFIEWTRQLTSRLFQDKFPELTELIGEDDPEFLVRVLGSHDAQSRWCEQNSETVVNSCAQTIAAALQAAVAQLSERHGADPNTWRWGEAHVATARHPLFGKFPIIGQLANLVSPRDGGWDTVNFSGYFYDVENHIYTEEVAPNLRAVYDLEDIENAAFSLSSGQSGHFLSPYYKNLTNDWIAGQYISIRTDYDAIKRTAIGHLVMTPPMNSH